MKRSRPRDFTPQTRFRLGAVVADSVVVSMVIVGANLFRTGSPFSANGRPGDLVGAGIALGAVVLVNWAFGLYRSPRSGAMLWWVGPVGVAATTAFVAIAASGAVLGRLWVSRPVLAALLLIVPGVLVVVRGLLQLRIPVEVGPPTAPLNVDEPGIRFAALGWIDRVPARPEAPSDPGASNRPAPTGHDGPRQLISVGLEPPSVFVIHRIDQWVTLLVAFWALPFALLQWLLRRNLVRLQAPNGAPVVAYDMTPGSRSHRIGLDLVPTLWSIWTARLSLLDSTIPDAQLVPTRTVRRWPFVLGWLISLRLFGLGHITGDTWDHILQGTGLQPLADWQPSWDAFIFWPSYQLFGSPILVTASVIGAFWLALYNVSRSIERVSGRNLTAVAVVIGFNPMLFNYMGLLAKDAFAAAVIVLSVSLLARERAFATHRPATFVAAGALLFTAGMFNPALIVTAAVLLTYLFGRVLVHRIPRPTLRFLFAGAVGGALALGTVAVERGMQAQFGKIKYHKEEAIMLFDLTGMSDELNQNLLPEGFLPPDRVDEYLNGCYDPREWDSVSWFGGRCTWVFSTDEGKRIWESGGLATPWAEAVQDHPGPYVEHRLQHVYAFQTSYGKDPTYYWWEMLDFEGNWTLERNRVMEVYSSFYRHFSSTLLFKPITWTVGTVLLMAIFLVRRRRNRASSWGLLPIYVGMSSIAFYAFLGIIGVAYDFRYNYSVIWLFFINLLLLISDKLAERSTDHFASSEVDSATKA